MYILSLLIALALSLRREAIVLAAPGFVHGLVDHHPSVLSVSIAVVGTTAFTPSPVTFIVLTICFFLLARAAASVAVTCEALGGRPFGPASPAP
ncbi:hypothetical protein EWM64_g5148 [Hericium alpestre]|uniref:Uncharacterized protein n=1 Tax=Hericium alpestre TaxID=135208 RepID=A0A4Y9ZXR5_9AGAM|nr:hypothetical protein EWM64_g5148 [Hericium alpestre]